jgi:hypothetical protein
MKDPGWDQPELQMGQEPVPPAPPAQTLERGTVYDSTGPNGEKIVIMTHETWTDFGTYLESLRNIARKQDTQLKEVKAENKVLVAQAADARTRLENLRAVRRAEKRPEIEALMETPTSTKAN